MHHLNHVKDLLNPLQVPLRTSQAANERVIKAPQMSW